MAIYNTFKKLIMDGGIDLDTGGDTIKVALTTSTYTPNIDTHDYFDDITNEVVGTGYTAGGATLANQATTVDTTDDEGVFDADDVAWTTSTLTARYAIIYKSTGTSSTSPLIGYIDFSSDKSSVTGTFTIQWNAEGILNLG
jgi:hypothetical protein